MGWPKPRERYGHGAATVVVEATLHQGAWEGHAQGEGWQVLGAVRKGGIRDGERQNWRLLARKGRKHWRARCSETDTPRSEGGAQKRPGMDLAGRLPYMEQHAIRILVDILDPQIIAAGHAGGRHVAAPREAWLLAIRIK